MTGEDIPSGCTPASIHEQSGVPDWRAAWAATWGG